MSLTNAYDSKLNKGYQVNNILLEIAKNTVGKPTTGDNEDIVSVNEDMDVSPFFYPLYSKEDNKVFIDIRPYTSINRDGSVKVRNTLDEQLNLLFANLELAWTRAEKSESIFMAFNFSNEIYARWLTDIITHRYGLTPYQRNRIMSLCGMFVIGQYYNNIEDPLTIERHLQSISRNLPLDLNTVKEVAANVENHFPRDVDEFVETLKKLDLGPRLRDFSTTALYNVLNGSWWATANAPQHVALAVEYPPAFAALCYMATEHSMFKRTGIGAKVDERNRGNAHRDFQRAVHLLVEKYV